MRDAGQMHVSMHASLWYLMHRDGKLIDVTLIDSAAGGILEGHKQDMLRCFNSVRSAEVLLRCLSSQRPEGIYQYLTATVSA